jgi:hypothetical protein
MRDSHTKCDIGRVIGRKRLSEACRRPFYARCCFDSCSTKHAGKNLRTKVAYNTFTCVYSATTIHLPIVSHTSFEVMLS